MSVHFVIFVVLCVVLSSDAAMPSSLFDLLTHSSQKEGERSEEEEEEEVVVEVMCLPASGCDLELYTAELLYRHRPIEPPVSPRKCTLKAKSRKKRVHFFG